jgi:dihydrofolate reductase
MRKIFVTEFLSLDGVMENPAWTFPYWNDEIAAFKTEETDISDALLLGRVTYEGIAASWPKIKAEKDPFAPYMNGVRKYVVSMTLDKVEWNNSVLIEGNLVEEVNKLKQQDGRDIAVHGSATLAQTLMEHDLVDSYRLLVYPVVVGKGKRLFKDGSDLKRLKLVDNKTSSTGVAILTYEPEKA